MVFYKLMERDSSSSSDTAIITEQRHVQICGDVVKAHTPITLSVTQKRDANRAHACSSSSWEAEVRGLP